MMTYCSNLVVAVKFNGKILREMRAEDGCPEVILPFGSEYSLLIKNLNSQRAVIRAHVDGQDALDSKEVVINPNSEMELKGFMKGHAVRNAFKFIEKTTEISEHRGDRVDDGLIRVEFAFELPTPKVVYEDVIVRKRPWWTGPWYPEDGYSWTSHTYSCSIGHTKGISGSNTLSNDSDDVYLGDPYGSRKVRQGEEKCSGSILRSMSATPKDGITVAGSEVNQTFGTTHVGALGNYNTIILRLKGVRGDVPVTKPLTVETKIECPTCGRSNKSNLKYCPNCGTNLQAV